MVVTTPERGGVVPSEQQPEIRRGGKVAIIGLPNAGKSTLLNAIIGRKISAVSRKKQTTQEAAQAIYDHNGVQITFIDTPGVVTAAGKINRRLMSAFWNSIQLADVVLIIIDAALSQIQIQDNLLKLVDKLAVPKYLLLNKIDLMSKEQLLPLAEAFNKDGNYQLTFMVSAQKRDGVDYLLHELGARLPQVICEEPVKADRMGEIEWLNEMTREAILNYVHAEIPYRLEVVTTHRQEKNAYLVIYQTIYAENIRHCGIIIGNKGDNIRRICRQARQQISKNLDQSVRLVLKVKVRNQKTAS